MARAHHIANKQIDTLLAEHRESILAMVRAGAEPKIAAQARGISDSMFRRWREAAEREEQPYLGFWDQLQTAVAEGETEDILVTKRAASIGVAECVCPHCGKPYEADPIELAATCGRLDVASKLKKDAADVALRRLERRFPARHAQRIIATIQTEQQGFLDAVERILAFHGVAGEVFAEVLAEYVGNASGQETRALPIDAEGE